MIRVQSTILLLTALSVLAAADPPTRSELLESRAQLIQLRKIGYDHRQQQPAALPEQLLFDVTWYGLNLDLDTDTGTLTGSVALRAVVTGASLEQIVLNLAQDMVVDSVSGDALRYVHERAVLTLELDYTRALGDTVDATVFYHGQPQSGGLYFDTHGNNLTSVWSLSEPWFAREWWPCKDTPTDKADAVDIRVTLLENLVVVSNGNLLSDVNNGDGTHSVHWREQYPIATYLVSVAVAEYITWSDWFVPAADDSLEVQFYVYPEAAQAAREPLAEVVDMLSVFSDLFGLYPFMAEKYGIAQFGRGGGMEHQTISSQGSFGSMLNAHELAHQWFGDKLTNGSWADIWLNEGFASYAEALYYEVIFGADYYREYMSWMDHPFQYALLVSDTTSVARIFDNTVYDKGAWVLHMLRRVMGDSLYFPFLLDYATDPVLSYGTVTNADLQRIAEAHYGSSLGWFFDAWLHQVGRPEYVLDWVIRDSVGAWFMDLSISQQQSAVRGLFPMPLELLVETVRGDSTYRFFNGTPLQTLTFALPGEPLKLHLDPNSNVLKNVQYLQNPAFPPSGSTGLTLRPNYPNPFRAHTRIPFELPRPARVTTIIYDLLGREVITLTRVAPFIAGSHDVLWNGLDHRGRSVPSGIYVVQLVALDGHNGAGVETVRTRKIVRLQQKESNEPILFID